MSQCPSCGGDCGYLKNKGCQYGKKTLPDMLTPQEHQEIVRIVARWDYATEAAIEAYLLGKKLSDNVAQAYLKGFDEGWSSKSTYKEALAQPAQEPVAYVTGMSFGRFIVEPLNPAMVLPVGMALYSLPLGKK